MDPEEAITLQAFLEQTIADITDEKPVNVERVLSQLSLYPPAKTYLARHIPSVNALLATNPKDVGRLLQNLLRDQEIVLPEAPAGIDIKKYKQWSVPDVTRLNSLPSRTAPDIEQQKYHLILEELQTNATQSAERARAKVPAWIKALKAQSVFGTDEAIEKALRPVVAPVYAETTDDARKEIDRRIETSPVFSKDAHAAKSALADEALSLAWDPKTTAAIKILITNEGITAPPAIIRNALPDDIIKNGRIDLSEIDKGTRYAKMDTAVRAEKKDYTGLSVGDFVPGPIKPLANLISALPGAKDEALLKAFQNNLAKVINATDVLNREFGADLVRSDGFQTFLQSVQSVATQKESAKTLFGGLGRLVGDLMEPIKGPPSEQMVMFLKVLYEHRAAIGTTMTFRDFFFSQAPLLWNRTGTLLAGSGAAKAAGKIASLGFGGAKNKLANQLFAFLIKIHIPEAVAGFFSAGLAWILAALGLLWEGIKKLVTAFSAGIFNAAGAVTEAFRGFGLPAPKKDWTEKNQLLIAIAVGALSVLCLGWIGDNAALDSIQLNTTGNLETCANIQGVHIYQMDPQWDKTPCSDPDPSFNQKLCSPLASTGKTYSCNCSNTTCTIGASGCGSASMAMILAAFGDKEGVVKVWNDQHDSKVGGYVYGSGTDSNGVSRPGCESGGNWLNILTNAGLQVNGIGTDELVSAFKSSQDQAGCNHILIASTYEMFAGNTEPSGHIIDIVGAEQTGSGITITALDPARREDTSTLRVVDSKAAAKAGGDGSVWITGLWDVINPKGGNNAK